MPTSFTIFGRINDNRRDHHTRRITGLHSIEIDQPDRIIPAENIRTMVLLQGILREPPPVKFVVTTCAVVRETVSDEYLILFTVEVVPIVRNWQRCRVSAFSERIVVVAFEDVVLICRHDTHAFQMIGQEITNLGVVAGCCHNASAAERYTFNLTACPVFYNFFPICKRTPIRKTAVVGLHRREFRTVCKVRIFRDNRTLSTSNNILYST